MYLIDPSEKVISSEAKVLWKSYAYKVREIGRTIIINRERQKYKSRKGDKEIQPVTFTEKRQGTCVYHHF